MRDNLRTLLLLAILVMAVLAGSALPDIAVMWIILCLALIQAFWWLTLFAEEVGPWTTKIIRPLMKWTMSRMRKMKRRNG